MNEKELQSLISLFEESSLRKIEIEKTDDSWKVVMEKGRPDGPPPMPPMPPFPGPMPGMGMPSAPVSAPMAPEASAPAAAPVAEASAAAPASNLEQVTAPLVGVFYEAPSPDDEPFVKLGQKVEAGQTLCLIEAMKMMSELKSPVDGIIKRICVQNSDLVEFGQVIYEVEPC